MEYLKSFKPVALMLLWAPTYKVGDDWDCDCDCGKWAVNGKLY